MWADLEKLPLLKNSHCGWPSDSRHQQPFIIRIRSSHSNFPVWCLINCRLRNTSTSPDLVEMPTICSWFALFYLATIVSIFGAFFKRSNLGFCLAEGNVISVSFSHMWCLFFLSHYVDHQEQTDMGVCTHHMWRTDHKPSNRMVTARCFPRFLFFGILQNANRATKV